MNSKSVTFIETARETARLEIDEDVKSVGHETKLTDIKVNGPVSAYSNKSGVCGMVIEHQHVHRNHSLTHQLQVFDPRESEVLSRSTSIGHMVPVNFKS